MAPLEHQVKQNYKKDAIKQSNGFETLIGFILRTQLFFTLLTGKQVKDIYAYIITLISLAHF
jgi:hypothetical protein